LALPTPLPSSAMSMIETFSKTKSPAAFFMRLQRYG
jgi:hypothetical protein